MNKILSILSLAAAGMAVSCVANVHRDGNQVTVRVQSGDARLVRLEVMGPKIIRVSATADAEFADKPSLIVVPQQPLNEPINVRRIGDTLTVET